MQTAVLRDQPSVETATLATNENQKSGVSWGAIFAGATASAVLSLVLFILGFGLGLSVLSPWRNVDGSTFAWTAIAWVAFTQIAASGVGGYLAGRLRVKWARVHGDEVYFRDTAHGFLTWGLASLLTAFVFSSSSAMLIGSAAKATGAIAASTGAVATSAAMATPHNGNAQASTDNGSALQYYVDSLFRNANASAAPADANATSANSNTAPADANAASISAPTADERSEILRIFSHSLMNGDLSAADRAYLDQIVARHSGLSPADADARVTAIYNDTRNAVEQAKTTADKARKAAAYTALWMFIALLCGAFVASLCATWGGKQRDAFSLNS